MALYHSQSLQNAREHAALAAADGVATIITGNAEIGYTVRRL